ncbi:hypothetical protein FB567DRAFT_598063 [Paraphoma chrysanthemicola]|uniref:Single domain-containing protein n=1 Tax=Paraphoma chrysanthemicola TaxID=798071 RepID=A0A8K0QTR3_9PLEO|nr:hypothetical protein FB567DRAFT_598063 [Paraphoma chrysanthemicola]
MRVTTIIPLFFAALASAYNDGFNQNRGRVVCGGNVDGPGGYLKVNQPTNYGLIRSGVCQKTEFWPVEYITNGCLCIGYSDDRCALPFKGEEDEMPPFFRCCAPKDKVCGWK